MEPATPACLGAKGSQTRPLCRIVSVRAVVRVYRAGLVAECEMSSHGLIYLITDPPYPSRRFIILNGTLSTIDNASHNFYMLFDYSAIILLHV